MPTSEIERVLAAHPHVEQAVVLPPKAENARQQLLACIVKRPGSSIDSGDLKQFLAGRLPSAMIPSAFVFVERRIEQPLLNVAIFRIPGVGSGLATLAAGMTAYGGFLFAVGIHLQTGLGDSALLAGLTLVLRAGE